MTTARRFRSMSGQSLIEFSIVLPLIVVVALGVVEVSYALLDQHIVTKLTREGSNLISRNTSLGDAATAMRTMSSRPVNLDDGSRLIFSVIRNVPTIGAANYNQAILSQRYWVRQPLGCEHDSDTRQRLIRRRAGISSLESG